ncbi:MAG: hypothetical protein AMXMBFR33_10250 [Candidatus Xenobia bacterium]
MKPTTLVTLIFSLLVGAALAGDPAQPTLEQMKKLYPAAASFVKKPLDLSGHTREHIEEALGFKLDGHDLKTPAYVVRGADGRSLGAVWPTDVHLPEGKYADVLVGVDTKGAVVGVLVWGGPVPAIQEGAYLEQYKGKNADSPIRVGKDIKPAAGQKGPSADLADSVRRAVLVLSHGLLKAHQH